MIRPACKPSPNVPDYDKHIKQVHALLARKRKELAALIAAARPRPPLHGELVRPNARARAAVRAADAQAQATEAERPVLTFVEVLVRSEATNE